MKRLFLFIFIITFVLSASVVYAAEKAPLGIGNVAMKLNYIEFTEDDLKDLDVYTEFYIGLEGYAEIMKNLYLGAEIGYANPVAEDREWRWGIIEIVEVDSEVTFVPIEINLKYAIEPTPNFVIDVGSGISYNFTEVYLKENDGTFEDIEDNDWLFGGQFFVDLNFKVDKFFIGINGKYQITEDFEIEGVDTDLNFNNWRIGGQIGIMF